MKTGSVPFYMKLSHCLIVLALLAALLHLAQGILVPLFFSILLATLLVPVVKFLERIRIPKVIAIILAILVSFLTIAGIIYFLSHQVSVFLEDIDTIKERLTELTRSMHKWVRETFNISTSKQKEYLKDTAENMKDSGPGFLGQTVLSITSLLAYLVFLPIYTFLILYYKELIRRFLISQFKNGSEEQVSEVLYQSRSIGQHYIVALMIDMTIVFTLNSIGFLVLGIKYAIFLALVGALLNLVPYIGMLIANVFCMLITLVSSESTTDVIWVAVILAAVQFIDNNFLVPMVVGTKVRINALVTILGVVVGGALCGVGGMFLAIPAIAVLKVIFDHVEDLKPWGMLLGDEVKGERAQKRKPIR
jgi:predicted PurR-regulated permease PerM